MSSVKYAVELNDVHKIYAMGRVKVEALRGVFLKIESGDMVAVVGPSGSGKTTLLNIIGLLDRPTKGKIYINGVDVEGLNENSRARLRLNYLGFIFQMFHLVPWLNALENVELPLMIAGIPRSVRIKRALECLRLVGLEDRVNHRPSELSGGEQQRVAIARAIANRPKIILADEPTGNLDSATGLSIVTLLKKLNEELKTTVIMVTHNMDVAKLTNRIFYIRDGVIEREEVV
ncbi:MAG: ABC transporter ATP-binding protein [Candidatus Methanomethylicota archaeon]|nr:MAG: ABC transporter ATP-binding protein [Candidatus Verstraetearchaeota archaeon]